MAITKNSQTGPGTGKTKLDKERMKLCEREIVNHNRYASHTYDMILTGFSFYILIGSHWEYGKESSRIGYKKFHEGTISNRSKLLTEVEIFGRRCGCILNRRVFFRKLNFENNGIFTFFFVASTRVTGCFHLAHCEWKTNRIPSYICQRHDLFND